MRSVLIIEDHAESCRALEALLRFRGFEAACVGTMAEGVEKFNERRDSGAGFDVVVSDLCLPHSNATQTIETLTAFAPTPVRAISGVQDPVIIAACAKAGIRLILKGTSAEGIMESILYAMLEHPERGPDIETAQAIAENRIQAREIPLVQIKGLIAEILMSLPRWAQTCVAIAGIVGFLGSTATGATLFYKAIYDKGATANQVMEESNKIQAKINSTAKTVEVNGGRISALESEKTSLSAKVDNLSEKVETNKRDTNDRLDQILRAVLNKR